MRIEGTPSRGIPDVCQPSIPISLVSWGAGGAKRAWNSLEEDKPESNETFSFRDSSERTCSMSIADMISGSTVYELGEEEEKQMRFEPGKSHS
jgi:hypothetical protein